MNGEFTMMLIHRNKKENTPYPPLDDWKSPLQKWELLGKGENQNE